MSSLQTPLFFLKCCQDELLRFLKHQNVDLWIIHIEPPGGHESIQAKAREERRKKKKKEKRRTQNIILWINSIPRVSIVRKLYVALRYTIKRYNNLAITNIVNQTLVAFCLALFLYLKEHVLFSQVLFMKGLNPNSLE